MGVCVCVQSSFFAASLLGGLGLLALFLRFACFPCLGCQVWTDDGPLSLTSCACTNEARADAGRKRVCTARSLALA